MPFLDRGCRIFRAPLAHDALLLFADHLVEAGSFGPRGKITLPDDVDDAIDRSAVRDLPVTRRHTLASDLMTLPHKDPFDAVLVAQATVERLTLLTADAKLLKALPDAVDARL